MPENDMKKKLNFELPQKETGKRDGKTGLILFLLIAVLIAVCADIYLSADHSASNMLSHRVSLDADQQKKLALKLEKQGLFRASADAWRRYLDIAKPDETEIATIWYRIGKLYQDNNAFENALAAYYRSESFASVESISPEISLRIQECLESMGKFSAMRHELINRVDLNATGKPSKKGEKILAEIGTYKITEADLDQQIEMNIDQQMQMLAPYLPEEDRLKQKETLLEQLLSQENQKMFLNQFIVEELLYRKAREDRLADDQKVENLISSQERKILAQLVLEKEYENKIHITLSDLQSYFESNKDQFKKEDGTEPVFDDVKNDVYKSLRRQKEDEIRQQLLTQLRDKYDVVVHQSAFDEEPPSGQTDPKNQ